MRGPAELRRPGAVNTLQLVELLAVDFGVRAEEVEVRSERLPFALGLGLLFRDLVALALVNMKNLDLEILGSPRHIGENRRALAEVSDHVATHVAGEHRARERVFEQDLDHLRNLIKSTQGCLGALSS